MNRFRWLLEQNGYPDVLGSVFMTLSRPVQIVRLQQIVCHCMILEVSTE